MALNFKPLQNPRWRRYKTATECPSVEQMIEDIVKFRKEFEEETYDENHLKSVRKDFLVKYSLQENGEEKYEAQTPEETRKYIEIFETDGESKPPLPRPSQESSNVYRAYSWLHEITQKESSDAREENLEDEDLYGLLQENIVKEVHLMIFTKLSLKENDTKPGEYSKNPRQTTYKGEEYEYQNPPNMSNAVNDIIDQYNNLITSVKSEDNTNTKITNLFKISSWLLFEFLDLHPFSNGNGRLGRLLCNYALSVLTPFVTPIYNIWSQSRKDDYIQALKEARESPTRHPEALTTMLIECNWFAWKEFVKQLDELKTKQMRNEPEEST